MVRLVDDLLDVSRIANGKLSLHKVPLNLTQIIGSAVEFARPLMADLDHDLSIELSPQTLQVEGDPVRLTQIFSNLLNNAAKYTERGGQINLTCVRDGDIAVITVKDSGIGLDQQDLAHIFRTFSQVTMARGRSQGGLGIGLSLVQGFVELHGGKVEARSAGKGLGSEFIVRLPALPDSSGDAMGGQS
jgi:signal transduction histidine kinase